ncbi:uncharacterized protein AB9X84_021630 isoform 2-T2 [Acanthopagrus schlegelii]
MAFQLQKGRQNVASEDGRGADAYRRMKMEMGHGAGRGGWEEKWQPGWHADWRSANCSQAGGRILMYSLRAPPPLPVADLPVVGIPLSNQEHHHHHHSHTLEGPDSWGAPNTSL